MGVFHHHRRPGVQAPPHKLRQEREVLVILRVALRGRQVEPHISSQQVGQGNHVFNRNTSNTVLPLMWQDTS